MRPAKRHSIVGNSAGNCVGNVATSPRTISSCAAQDMNVYVALRRGINVGGSNLIRMPALKACFAA